MIYQWREGRSMGVPAQVAGDVLEGIRERDGKIDPGVVVSESRLEAAPLHDVFEWRNKVAAELYRRDQARQVIRSVEIVMEESDEDDPDEEPVPRTQIAFVSIGSPVKGGSAYISTVEALSDSVMRERVLRDAIIGLKSWQARYGHLEELAEIVAVIENVQAITT
jgi:hypothetical protein